MTENVQNTNDDAPRVQRVDRPDSPDRCESSTSHGQCWIVKVPGSRYCKMHGGQIGKSTEAKMYRLQKYQARLTELKDHEAALSLRNEIGILRMTLEEILNKCDNAVDLMIHSAKISRLVQDIGKLVVESKKLEAGLGNLLDRQVVLTLASAIIDVIGEIIDDPDQLAQIAVGIETIIERTVLGVHHD